MQIGRKQFFWVALANSVLLFLLFSCGGKGFSDFMRESEFRDVGSDAGLEDAGDGGEEDGGNDGGDYDAGDGGEPDDAGSVYPSYLVTIEPDFGRRKQYVSLKIQFPEDAPVDFYGESGVYIAGKPDFGGGVFVRSWAWEPGHIRMTIYIDESASTGKRLVSLLVEDDKNIIMGKGEFYVLPSLE